MEKYGYVRVSTKEQKLDRQYEALMNYGLLQENIYEDRLSGKDFNRPNYKRRIKKLKSGDTLVIKSIDRLGRNYDEILEQWRIICKDIKADVEVLDMPLLNTNQKQEGLIRVFISDLVLQILAYVAETERNFIKQRQAEGIAIAKAKGVHFGRERLEPPEEFMTYLAMCKNGEMSLHMAAKKLNISKLHIFVLID